MKTQNTMKTQNSITFHLVRNPKYRGTYFTKWYILTKGSQKIQFATDSFNLPKAVQTKLNAAHSKKYTQESLTDACFDILLPHLEVIWKEALEYLAIPRQKRVEMEQGFRFDPKFSSIF